METETLFQYLYRVLREQILSQTLREGSLFPSSRELSRTYNVGIRTVKDVMHKLHDDGYIRMQERKRAVVIYHKDNEKERIEKLLSMHERSIDVLYASNYIFPSYYARAAKLLHTKDLIVLQDMLNTLADKQYKTYYKVVQEFHLYILSRYHNPMITDLYLHVEHCIHIPRMDNEVPCPYSQQKITQILNTVLDHYRHHKTEYIFSIYRQLHKDLMRYSETQLHRHGQTQTITPSRFIWNPQKGHTSQYTRVFHHLVHKITSGVYQDGDYLPSIEVLAQEYAVSRHTMRKALRHLHAIGLVEIKNGIGTQCTFYKGLSESTLLKDEEMIQAALMYLSSFQIIAMNIRSLSYSCFSMLRSAYLQKETHTTAHKEPKWFIQTLIRQLPRSALKTIYSEIREVILWGSYFSIAGIDPQHEEMLRHHYKTVLSHLRHKRPHEFAFEVEALYVSLFHMMCQYIRSMGIQEAELVPLPI